MSDRTLESKQRPWSAGAGRRAVLKLVVPIAVLLMLGAVWRWTPLAQWLTLNRLLAWTEMVREYQAAPLYIALAYVVGGVLMVPVTLLILVTTLILDPWTGLGTAMVGCVASAFVCYALGRVLGQDLLEQLSGTRFDGMRERLVRKGLVSMLVLRTVPVAPFTIVNLMAGAMRVGMRDYLLGTIVGMAPGIIALTLFKSSVQTLLRSPDAGSYLLAGCAVVVLIVVFSAGRWFRQRTPTTHQPA